MLTLVLASAACERAPVFMRPPDGSFEIATMRIEIDGKVESLQGARITDAFFPGTQASPLVGRRIQGDDFTSDHRVVMISEDLWRSRFKANPSLIGQAVQIDDAPTVIVGVAPPKFRIPDGAQLWMPKLAR